MSLPVHLFNIPIIVNGNMSSSITSSSTDINEAVSYCIQATFTGSPVGSLKIQASDDQFGVPPLLGFVDLPSTITAVTQAGTYMVNVEFPSYCQVQLVYTATSGSGTINAKINAKRR